uniref:SAP domain-containing protein n=1 Tax=Strongyloides papillosus TaxID=174720 RepID=A0A0N5B360_STREA
MSTEIPKNNNETPRTGGNDNVLNEEIINERMKRIYGGNVVVLKAICQMLKISYQGKKVDVVRRLAQRPDFDVIFAEHADNDNTDNESEEGDETFTLAPMPKETFDFTQDQLNAMVKAFTRATITEISMSHSMEKQNNFTFTSKIPIYQHSESGISGYLRRLSLALKADNVTEKKKSIILVLKMPEEIQRQLYSEFQGKPEIQSFQTLVAALERSYKGSSE